MFGRMHNKKERKRRIYSFENIKNDKHTECFTPGNLSLHCIYKCFIISYLSNLAPKTQKVNKKWKKWFQPILSDFIGSLLIIIPKSNIPKFMKDPQLLGSKRGRSQSHLLGMTAGTRMEAVLIIEDCSTGVSGLISRLD